MDKVVAAQIMDWKTIEEAADYFNGQNRKEIGFLNKYELISFENLQRRLGYSKGALSASINKKISQQWNRSGLISYTNDAFSDASESQ
ncbi:MAG: hypothetical protein PVJ84_22175 [Desulfobacteraceae bacterium]|jgi:hypothetical protein